MCTCTFQVYIESNFAKHDMIITVVKDPWSQRHNRNPSLPDLKAVVRKGQGCSCSPLYINCKGRHCHQWYFLSRRSIGVDLSLRAGNKSALAQWLLLAWPVGMRPKMLPSSLCYLSARVEPLGQHTLPLPFPLPPLFPPCICLKGPELLLSTTLSTRLIFLFVSL